jgi:DnaJ-class molecular chaperone
MSQWNPIETEYLNKMLAAQTAQNAVAAVSKKNWETGSDIDPEILSNVTCPNCNGKGRAVVQDRDGVSRSVGLYACRDTRCGTCFGTGKLPKVALAAMLAQI